MTNLAKYGTHLDDCPSPTQTCNCGFSQAVADDIVREERLTKERDTVGTELQALLECAKKERGERATEARLREALDNACTKLAYAEDAAAKGEAGRLAGMANEALQARVSELEEICVANLRTSDAMTREISTLWYRLEDYRRAILNCSGSCGHILNPKPESEETKCNQVKQTATAAHAAESVGSTPAATSDPSPAATTPHERVCEYDGAFRCLDCGAKWGALPGRPVMPALCLDRKSPAIATGIEAEVCAETPRTDERNRKLANQFPGDSCYVFADFARTLERELQTAIAERKEMLDKLRDSHQQIYSSSGKPYRLLAKDHLDTLHKVWELAKSVHSNDGYMALPNRILTLIGKDRP